MVEKKPKVIVFFDPPPPLGGVRVSSQQTFLLLQSHKDAEYIPMKFSQPLLEFLFALIKNIPLFLRANLILYQVNGLLAINEKRFLFTILLNKLFLKKMAFRGFGGGIKNTWIDQSSYVKRLQIYLINQMRFMTLQTRSDYEFFLQNSKIKTRLYWMPNTRPILNFVNSSIQLNKINRFCFVGKVWKEKGIDVIVSAAKKLPKEISIDVFGPVTEDVLDEFFRNANMENHHAKVTYKGEISRSQILETLASYHALLFPTRWVTEGHPGVILEAFSVGLPVIASNWNGIPELLDESSGILIDNKSDDELVKAILRIREDIKFYQKLRIGARARGNFFKPESWASNLHQWILEEI
jgi:glycosyltransferase involved in cell wall biosynthesis